jgi:hypothetical protein
MMRNSISCPRFQSQTHSDIIVLRAAVPASTVSMKEDSARYKAAQTAGTLGDQKWNYFRRARCGPDATAMPAPTPALPLPLPKLSVRATSDFLVKATTLGTRRHVAKVLEPVFNARVSDHARLTTVRGEVMQGKTAIEKGLPAIFASRATKDLQLRNRVHSRRRARPCQTSRAVRSALMTKPCQHIRIPVCGSLPGKRVLGGYGLAHHVG